MLWRIPALNVQGQVSALIDEMRGALASHNVQKFEAASDSLEVLVMAHTEPVPREFVWDRTKLTNQQRRMLTLLHSRLGKETSRDSLLSAIYFDYGDRPECDRKTIDVHICRIRKVLKDIVAPYRIETVWNYGFKMSALEAVRS